MGGPCAWPGPCARFQLPVAGGARVGPMPSHRAARRIHVLSVGRQKIGPASLRRHVVTQGGGQRQKKTRLLDSRDMLGRLHCRVCVFSVRVCRCRLIVRAVYRVRHHDSHAARGNSTCIEISKKELAAVCARSPSTWTTQQFI